MLKTRPRSTLRIADLKHRKPAASRLMNVKIPRDVAEAIDRLAKKLGVFKTDVVVALLNEGMNAASSLVGKRLKK